MKNQVWAELDENHCPCQGTGWAQIDNDIWDECFIHYSGQLHPESRMLLLDSPGALKEEERRSQLRFKIQKSREKILKLQEQLKKEQAALVQHELELINKTPTIKMKAINPSEMFELSDDDVVEDNGTP